MTQRDKDTAELSKKTTATVKAFLKKYGTEPNLLVVGYYEYGLMLCDRENFSEQGSNRFYKGIKVVEADVQSMFVAALTLEVN